MNGRRTVASVHNDWLTLVEPVGAFLTIPVLKRVFPNGIPPVERDIRGDVRRRLEELTTDVASRTGWLHWILRDILSLGPRLREASAIPAGLTHTVAERRLLELNLQRYAEEVVQGLHEKPTAKGKGGSATRRGRKPKASPLLEGV